MTPPDASDAPELSPQEAWRILFGSTYPGPSRRGQLDSAALKQAFRRRVLGCHPDRAEQVGRAPTDLQVELRRVVRAYHLLCRSTGSGAASDACEVRAPAVASPLPRRPLALAQLLCYLGWVPSCVVPAALVWQKAKRPRIGSVAVDLGLLCHNDRARVLIACRASERFGACARRLGVLTSQQLNYALQAQLQRQPRLGAYFVELGMITPSQLREALSMLRHHNASLHRATH